MHLQVDKWGYGSMQEGECTPGGSSPSFGKRGCAWHSGGGTVTLLSSVLRRNYDTGLCLRVTLSEASVLEGGECPTGERKAWL